MSVGVVMRQDIFFAKKKALGSPTGPELYRECLKLAPQVLKLLENAEIVSDVKSASDWSYSAHAYAGPNFRLVGDAGCFIDPYFSSGVHLALASGLSAALTIQAARRGDCDEFAAAKWHSSKVTEGYTRFLLVVMTALKQIRKQMEPVLSDFDEDGFDTAFGFFRPSRSSCSQVAVVTSDANMLPVIQGTVDADVSNKLTQTEVSKTVEFCLNAFKQVKPEERQAVLEKVKGAGNESQELERLSEDELRVLHTIRARQMLRSEDTLNLNNFSKDVIDGLMPNLKHGSLGLTRLSTTDGAKEPESADLFDLIKPGDRRRAQEAIKTY